MKKLICFLVIMILLLTQVAYADSTVTYADEAKVLYDLGLFKGVNANVYIPDLTSLSNREQAIKMVGVALDWKIDTAAKSAFSDVSDWAQPYVAMAVKLGITNGKSATKFAGKDPVTIREMTTWMLRAIGYGTQVAWDQVTTLSGELGINVDQNNKDIRLDRDLLVHMIFVSLKNGELMGDDFTLIERIVQDKPALLEIAKEGKLISPLFDASQYTIKNRKPVVNMESLTGLYTIQGDPRTYIRNFVAFNMMEPYDYVGYTVDSNGNSNVYYGCFIKEEDILSIDSVDLIVHKYRFGGIEYFVQGTQLKLDTVKWDESGYMTIYGLDVGDAIPQKYLLAYGATEVFKGYQIVYYQFRSIELGAYVLIEADELTKEVRSITLSQEPFV